MTITTPTYAARILGTPDVPVSLRAESGRITLDAATAPHVDATLTLAMTDVSVLDAADPRQGRRMVVEAGGRSFNLGIREANPNREESTVEVRLASDEALLRDHRPLTGVDMIQHADDIRILVEKVIQAATGDTVSVAGSTGSVYPLWSVTNLIPYPTGHSGVAGWVASTGASNLTAIAPPVAPPIGSVAVRWRANAGVSVVQVGGWNGVDASRVCAVTPGRLYTASIYLLSSTARAATIRLAFRDENGKSLPSAVYSATPVVTSRSGWTRLSVTGVPPKLARYAYIIVQTDANTEGQLHYGQAVMLTEGPFLPEPFTGGSSGPDYVYEWADAAQASPSTRTPARAAPDREALFWPAGMSALEFILPLVQVLGLRPVCDETRAWSLRSEAYRAAGAQAFRAGVNVITAREQLSRDEDDWFDGAVYRYSWTDRDGIQQTREDTFALPGASRVILREIDAPWPGAGRAEYAVRRAQGKGRTVTATKQATWTERAEQPLSVILDGTPIQTGIAERVVFDIAENTVTTTSRTIDTPAGAIDLLTGTIDALTGTINDL